MSARQDDGRKRETTNLRTIINSLLILRAVIHSNWFAEEETEKMSGGQRKRHGQDKVLGRELAQRIYNEVRAASSPTITRGQAR